MAQNYIIYRVGDNDVSHNQPYEGAIRSVFRNGSQLSNHHSTT